MPPTFSVNLTPANTGYSSKLPRLAYQFQYPAHPLKYAHRFRKARAWNNQADRCTTEISPTLTERPSSSWRKAHVGPEFLYESSYE